MDNNKVLMAMSGGVDSSVAAHLLKSEGRELIGAMMKLFTDEALGDIFEAAVGITGMNSNADSAGSRACCTLSDADDARAVANAMGFPFYVFNFTDTFAAEVMERFVRAYLAGKTPNPCIDCNRFMKFQRFLHRATELECGYIATGHYARIAPSMDMGGRFLLKTGIDPAKDQSYVLYAMTQEQLSRIRFPLGGMSKPQVREIALREGFAANAERRESQDICFIPDGDYARYIEKYTGQPPRKGRFVDTAGNDLGENRGIINYTVGQRRGLGLAMPYPAYVLEIRPEDDAVVVGRDEMLYSKTLTVRDINLIALDRLDKPIRAHVKIRYSHRGQPATVSQTGPDTLCVEFDEPQRAITNGQAAVIYDGDIVIGGGTIDN